MRLTFTASLLIGLCNSFAVHRTDIDHCVAGPGFILSSEEMQLEWKTHFDLVSMKR